MCWSLAAAETGAGTLWCKQVLGYFETFLRFAISEP